MCHWDVTRRVAGSSGTRTNVADCIAAGTITAASDSEVAVIANLLECGEGRLQVVWL